MAQQKIQTVRFGDKTVQIQTITIRGNECLRLEDVQRQFPSVTALSIDDVQIAFETDKNGENLKPLHIKACKDRIIEVITQNQRNPVMTQMYELHEFTTPRFFFILPAENHDWAAINAVQNLVQIHYRLYFLCECLDDYEEMHPALHEGYSIKKPKEFIAKYGPHLRAMLEIARVSSNLTSIAIPGAHSASKVIKEAQKLIDKIDPTNTFGHQRGNTREAPLQGADLRELASYLQVVDPNNRLGNLYRTVTADGHVRWVCLKHYDKISFNNEMSEYIRQWKSIGRKFNETNNKVVINETSNEVVINEVNLTAENVKMFRQTLEKGFNISKLVFEKCSIYESDLDKLLDVIINRSSIHCLEIIALDGQNRYRTSKCICQYMIINVNNQSLKVRCHDHYQSENAQMLIHILMQNKINRTLDFSACDFFGQENELRSCLDAGKLLTGLVVHYANNVEILNAISTLKDIKLEQLKLNYSLCLPSASSRFCEMLKNNQMLVEIDLMDSNEFTDETSIVTLLNTLRGHESIKHLSLHVSNVTPSNRIDDCLRESLLNYTFISGLCLSKSKISQQLTQALVHASGEDGSLRRLQLYQNEIDAVDISELQSSYETGSLYELIISDQPRRYSTQERNNQPEQGHQLNAPDLNIDQKWKEHGTTIAGGHGQGNELNQLKYPYGMFIDDDQTIYVADTGNDRIMKCKMDESNGQIVAVANDPLNRPTKVTVDKKNDSLIICDSINGRIVRWPRQNGQQTKDVLISDIVCWNLMMDNDGYLYGCDLLKHVVRRWKQGEKEGIIVAGGNGRGDRPDQLYRPCYIFIDEDHSVYVSDSWNHRVMKWVKGAKEGIIVAGGHRQGNNLNQLSYPGGVIVDRQGSIYIADCMNHRVMRWLKGATEGSIVVGGNRQGNERNQLNQPIDLSFDQDNYLYVVDWGNHRVQKFEISYY